LTSTLPSAAVALAPAAPGPDLLMVVDPATLRIVMANSAACEALGYPLEGLLAREINQIETTLTGFFYWEEVAAGRPQALTEQEDLYLCADGRQLAVTKSVSILNGVGQGGLLLIRAVEGTGVQPVHDALAQILSRLRATLEATSNGILVLDWDGRIGSMNRLFSHLWALPEAMLHGQDDKQVIEFLIQSVQESERLALRFQVIADPATTEDTLHHIDGRVLEFSSRPQYLGERIVGRVFSVQDITQRTLDAQALRESRDLLEQRVHERTAALEGVNLTLRHEKERLAALIQELESAQAQLLQSERMASIGQLAAGVAHEINNPIGFVNSNLGSLTQYIEKLMSLLVAYEAAEGQLPGPVANQLTQLKTEIDLSFMRVDIAELLAESLEGLQRVSRIVMDLKNFSHPDNSGCELADLEQGLESTLRVVWNELKYKCEVVKIYAGLPRVVCRPFQLNQVFMNLLVNAGQAIETKGTITLRTGFDEVWVWVEVADTGKGIPAEHLVRIFDPFFTTKPVGKGTGLGLSLAYGIVKKHGGRIEVQSTVGEGSRFRVWLPRVSPVEVVETP
jgi:two-component system, NtrC family, sensor kinase